MRSISRLASEIQHGWMDLQVNVSSEIGPAER